MRFTARATQSSAPASRTFTHAGACSKLPRNARSPVSAYGEDRAVDPAVEDGEEHVPALVGEQPLERRQDAVEERADRLAAQEARLLGQDAAEDAGERLPRGLRPGSRRGGRPRARAARATTRARYSGATIRAVSSVRARPLVTQRSKSTPARARVSPGACSSPSVVSGTASGRTGRPSGSKYATSAWRIR